MGVLNPYFAKSTSDSMLLLELLDLIRNFREHFLWFGFQFAANKGGKQISANKLNNLVIR